MRRVDPPSRCAADEEVSAASERRPPGELPCHLANEPRNAAIHDRIEKIARKLGYSGGGKPWIN